MWITRRNKQTKQELIRSDMTSNLLIKIFILKLATLGKKSYEIAYQRTKIYLFCLILFILIDSRISDALLIIFLGSPASFAACSPWESMQTPFEIL